MFQLNFNQAYKQHFKIYCRIIAIFDALFVAKVFVTKLLMQVYSSLHVTFQ